MAVYVKGADHTKRNELLAMLRTLASKIDALEKRSLNEGLDDRRATRSEIRQLHLEREAVHKRLTQADKEIEAEHRQNVATARAASAKKPARKATVIGKRVV